MTKAAAAKHLNVAPRTLERYVTKGRISGTYVKGDKGKELDFQFEDVERLRLELEADLTGTTATPDNSDTTEATPTTTALARVDPRSETALSTTRQARRDKTDSSDINVSLLSLKRLYTLEEVELLTGISKDRLRKAIKEDELVAGKDGRGWKVLPSALDAFLIKRFGGTTG